ncbi:MAG: hypothetical protein JWN14_4702 [Chthonomonadales bacterium]|nr:hypothetical protein [Chthonomonadales bacterium]
MRYSQVLAALMVFGLGLASMAAQAQGGNNPLITANERGVGSILFSGSPPTNMPGVLAADPGPGGLASALTYNLLSPPSLVAGDIFLVDTVGGPLSDLIRFNPLGTGGGAYPASLVFYSTDAGGALADTGSPSSFYTNTVTLLEGPGGVTLYTPTAGQPGFLAGFAATYDFISDDIAATTPEPGAVALFGSMGLSGVALLARRRKQARKSA